MKIITLYVPEGRLKQLDLIVKNGFFLNRAEAIRAGIDDIVKFYLAIDKSVTSSQLPKVNKISSSINKAGRNEDESTRNTKSH